MSKVSVAMEKAKLLREAGKERAREAEAKADSLLLTLLTSEWTIPALVAIALTLLGVGVVIGRVF